MKEWWEHRPKETQDEDKAYEDYVEEMEHKAEGLENEDCDEPKTD